MARPVVRISGFAGALVAGILAGCSSDQIGYTVSQEGIEINAAVHGRFVPRDALIMEQVRVTTLRDIRPVVRLWGVGQPGLELGQFRIDQYTEGWFGLENGEIALIFFSEHSHVLYMPTTLCPPRHVPAIADFISKLPIGPSEDASETFVLVLGTDEPESLLADLRDAWELR